MSGDEDGNGNGKKLGAMLICIAVSAMVAAAMTWANSKTTKINELDVQVQMIQQQIERD